MKNRHALLNGRRRQRGAVLIMFGLTLVVLIGFAGLAIDLGRFFVIKAELQNAMDACALSAASQLRPGRNDANALTRAVAYGRVFTTGGNVGEVVKNKANFQSGVVDISPTQITFSETLMPDENYQVSTTTDLYKTAQYAKCEHPLAGLPIYFMRVLNLIGLGPFTTQTVSAMAVATQGPQTCNLIPVGVCPRAGMSGTSIPPYGFNVGDWLKLGDPVASQVRGWFHWIQFPGQANGANGLRDALLEKGDCVIPTSSSQPQGGTINVAEWAWNKRFGIYKDADRPSTVPPDKTGYSYFNHTDPGTGTYFPWANWRNYPDTNPGTGARAFPHYTSTALPGFLNYRDSFLQNTPNSAVADPGILQPSNQYVASNGPAGEHSSFGRTDRRLVIIPIMNCTDTNVVQMVEDPVSNKPVLACALMLNPFGQVGGDKISGKIEYLGLVGASSPCGNANVTGPLMSVLVK